MALTDKQVNNKHERLTDKQAIFVEEYLKCFNATDAAKAAGYRGTRNVLASIGHTNLKIPAIAEVISQRMTEAAMCADEVMMRLAEQARASYSQYINADGSVDFEKIIADGKAHLIKSIKHTPYGKNIEFYDAQAAIQLIGKHHNLFVDRDKDGKPVSPVQVVVNQDVNNLTLDELRELRKLTAKAMSNEVTESI